GQRQRRAARDGHVDRQAEIDRGAESLEVAGRIDGQIVLGDDIAEDGRITFAAATDLRTAERHVLAGGDEAGGPGGVVESDRSGGQHVDLPQRLQRAETAV